MKKNTKNYDLRIDAIAIVMGDARARRYAETLRREIFESADEMNRYFGTRDSSELENFINQIEV